MPLQPQTTMLTCLILHAVFASKPFPFTDNLKPVMTTVNAVIHVVVGIKYSGSGRHFDRL